MLAKVAQELPTGEGFLFEPKWDGIRALVFRDASGVTLQGRDGKALNRQFPELEKVLVEQLPRGCVLDGEIVVAAAGGLDFDALQQRLHPAPSRIARLAKETPAAFVAFDLLAAGGAVTGVTRLKVAHRVQLVAFHFGILPRTGFHAQRSARFS